MAEIKTLWIPIDTARVSVSGDGNAKVWCMLKSDLAKLRSARNAEATVLRPGEDGGLVKDVRGMKKKPSN